MLLGPLLRALAVHTLATAAVGVLLRLLRPPLRARWFRVGPGERRWHRRAGVAGYRRALRAIGWEHVIGRVRGFDGTRAGLPGLDRHTRLSEASHLLGGAAALLVLGVDGRGVALAVAVHAHPVLLQRSLRGRIAAVTVAGTGQPAREAIAAASATSASSTVRTAGRAAALGRSTASTSRAARTPASGRRTRRRPPRSSVE